MKHKILIIGSRGMLGQELVSLFQRDREYAVTAWDKKELDITEEREVRAEIGKLKPDYILNAAAYNAVDQCENPKEYRQALALNGRAPGYLARAAKKAKAVLIHYSSDYVFSGNPEFNVEPAGCTGSCGSCGLHRDFKPEVGFKEDSRPKPINQYGKTKLTGERAVAKNTKRYYIIRLSKLFGRPGKEAGSKRSFFDVMRELGKKQKTVKVVYSETSSFTYAPDLARKTKEIIEARKPFGIYHVSNGDPCTWYEAAVELFRQARMGVRVVPVGPKEFPRPAARAEISTLINTKTNPLRSYKVALAEYLRKRKNS